MTSMTSPEIYYLSHKNAFVSPCTEPGGFMVDIPDYDITEAEDDLPASFLRDLMDNLSVVSGEILMLKDWAGKAPEYFEFWDVDHEDHEYVLYNGEEHEIFEVDPDEEDDD